MRYVGPAVAIAFVGLAGLLPAQSVISVKSGLVNYAEGKVLLDGKPVQVKYGNIPQIKNGSELRSAEGRAEVLLGPGVFLRLGENSAVRMVSDDISATRLQFVSGSAVVECAELGKDESVTLSYRDANISLQKNGVYRLDGDPAQLRVYDGEAKVTLGGQVQTVKRSKLLPLDSVAVAEKFDTKNSDALFRWSRRRAEYLAVANVSAAKQASQFGFSGSGSNRWAWNPYFGMYTYVPMNGIYNSYWGWTYWSPSTVYMMPVRGIGSGNGTTVTRGGTTYTNPSMPSRTMGQAGLGSSPTASRAGSGSVGAMGGSHSGPAQSSPARGLGK